MSPSVLTPEWLFDGHVEYSLLPVLPEDTRNAPWCLSYWAEWVMEPVKDEETLRKYTKPIVGAFYEASWRNDLAAMGRLIALHDFGYRYCQEEPFLTPYELTLMYILQVLADIHLSDGRLEASLADLELIDHCLNLGDARRAAVGMQHRPNSELRLDVLGLRAGCFADPLAHTLPDPAVAAELCNEFWQVADAMVSRLTQHTSVRRINLLGIIVVREMEICKLAYKVDRGLFVEAVDAFNRRYGADLTNGDPRASYDAQSTNTSWYWDMEVWKHLHVTQRNHVALQECMQARESTMPLQYGKSPRNFLKKFWHRQALAA
jgi:hypothetical protein